MRVCLVHGFNVSDGGANTVDRLAPYLQAAGHTVDCDEADYGWFGLWAVRFAKYSAVRRIMAALLNADAVISHSNGANYEHKALRLLAHRGKKYLVVRLSPALNSGTGGPSNIEKAAIFHTRTDWVVWASALLWFHPWGRQGWGGYKGKDPRFVNYDFTDLVPGHSDWFTHDNIEWVAQEIIAFLEDK